ncbi:hypothetical protein [Swaminathania salitolerans]|uniref:Uncharacterized protein n=1 Tax=Swaminathania salitolerans TaxID=182838 RepID=A0A511BQG6_9PROT|nr:hypothetical protein [Swaminathania salitolerans]GBQ11665.1 hypothetical protein AA21291_0921 [Swaminathania salitolerans LMG 21291]GEL02581.1 hypothetical protein SSA02_17440 [Swaminathania salitolerans]
MSKIRFVPAFALATLLAAPIAHAQTSGCNKNTSGTDMIGRLANSENCVNDRMKAWQEKNKASQEARQKKIDDLRDKYANAPARERQKIQDKIDNQKNKLAEMRKNQTDKLDQWRNKQQDQKNRLKSLSDKTRQDFTNFRNGQ